MMGVIGGRLANVTFASNNGIDTTALKLTEWSLSNTSQAIETTGFASSATFATLAPGGILTVTGLYPSTPKTGASASVTTDTGLGQTVACESFTVNIVNPMVEVTGFSDSSQRFVPTGSPTVTGGWRTYVDSDQANVTGFSDAANSAGQTLTLNPTGTANDTLSGEALVTAMAPRVAFNGVPAVDYAFNYTGDVTIGSAMNLLGATGAALGPSVVDSATMWLYDQTTRGAATSGDIAYSAACYWQSLTLTSAARGLINVTATYQLDDDITETRTA